MVGFTTTKVVGGYKAWLVKTDASGNHQWDKTFGENQGGFANSLIQTQDGGFAVAGSTKGDMWLIKTDILGNYQWDKAFGEIQADSAQSLLQTQDGGFVIAGSTSSGKARNSDMWLVKTDTSGNQLWNKIFGGGGNEGARSLIQTQDGGFAMTGYTSSTGNFGEYIWLRLYYEQE